MKPTTFKTMLTFMIATMLMFSFLFNQAPSEITRSKLRDLSQISQQQLQETHTICTYFEPLGLDPEKDNSTLEVVHLWEKSWSRNGWHTKVLTEKDAALHPEYQSIKERLLKLPTVNTKAYEMSCYLRWVAVLATGCKWMADLDMINYGFPPQPAWKGKKLFSFEGHTPSLVTGSKEAFQTVLNTFLSVADNPGPPAVVQESGRPHTSDMIILSENRHVLVDLRFPAHLSHDNPTINHTVLIHFAAGYVRQYSGDASVTKAQMIRTFRPF